MSKSKGEFLTVDLLINKGYDPLAYRLFCLQSHYRRQLVFSYQGLDNASNIYKTLKTKIQSLKNEGEVENYQNYREKFRKSLEDDLNISAAITILYDSLKDRYAISILIDMIDKEILFKEYKDKTSDAEDYADEQVKNLKKNYDSEEELLKAINSYYGYNTIKEFKEYIELNYFRDLATTDYAKKTSYR